jgi:hypothetical protein
MQKMLIRVLSLVMLGALITSCGNDRNAQIDLACNKVQDAWNIYIQFRDQIEGLNGFSDGDVIRFWSLRFTSQAAEPLNEAGRIFRDLSSQDSGFAQYAAKAFEMAQNDFYRNWSVESLRDLTAYCGTKIEGSGN